MKRAISVVLILSMLCALCGCSILQLPSVEKQDIAPATEESSASTSATDAVETEATAEATEEQPTTAPTQPPAVATDISILDGFDADEMYRINVFLSNFSEQNFKCYPANDYALVMFGYIYAKINNREVVETEGSDYCVAKGNMDSILKRFFARTVSVTDPTVLTGPYSDTIRFTDGKYRFLAADGASYSYCSVATSMISNGDGTYRVTFDVYEGPLHSSMSPYYSLTSDQAKANSALTYLRSGTAVVRDYTRSNGVASYQLVSYSCP